MNKILIATEAGKDIGLGHYIRCSTIQEEFLNNNIDARMLLYIKGDTNLEVRGEFCNWLTEKDIHIRYKDFDYILVDSYLADVTYFDYLKKNFKKVFVIDDYNRIKYDVDLIINPNVFFEDIDYQNQKAIGGKNFVILRKVFRNHNYSQVSNHIQRLLITIGGSDFRNLLPTLLEISLQSAVPEICIIDPEAKIHTDNLPHVHILGRQNEKEIFENYQKADIVIAACGQTLHELASMGKPTVGICLDIDQEPNQKYYFEKGFLLKKIAWNEPLLKETILENIALLKESLVIKLISHYAPTLVSKKGVTSLVSELTKYV
jgi:spore coat polysaccharide biosynthesis predicted glycosyltransferase SpsG